MIAERLLPTGVGGRCGRPQYRTQQTAGTCWREWHLSAVPLQVWTNLILSALSRVASRAITAAARRPNPMSRRLSLFREDSHERDGRGRY